jgi:hypothetical protein
MVWEHRLQELVINLIVGTAMALPRGYNRSRLIWIESLSAHFQLLEVYTQDEVKQKQASGVQRFGRPSYGS